ncbi:MAG: DNA polymerase III subunit delta' [Deltaproteobacteria bacterium]|nr:DNA polymerase III subunit delta' [Deltaproteobacteria bacterium]
MKFSDLIGQEKALNRLTLLVTQNKVPSTLLFHGPEGVGKKTAALLLAQTILCEQHPREARGASQACGVCPSCLRTDRGNHPNLRLLLPEGTSHKIETVREILRQISLKPYGEGCLIIIIDQAEKLTEAAANALLKTLEEPPPAVLFILVTAAPGLLPATILSRCQKVPFQPLSEDWVQKKLTDDGLPQEEASLIAKASHGSLGTAQNLAVTLHDQELSLGQFFSRFPHFTAREVTQWTEKIAKDPETTNTFLLLLRHCLREKLLEGKSRFSVWNAVDEAERAIQGHSPRNLTLEVLLHRITR